MAVGNRIYEVSALKNKLFNVLSYVMVAVAAAMLTLVLTTVLPGQNKLTQLEKLLSYYYVDGVDREALEDAAAEGMVSALGDRWSYYIPASQMGAWEENKNNAYVGIGVTIQAGDDGYRVTHVTAGGPAEEAGILPGDILTAADGHSLVGLSAAEGKQFIQGKIGTTVEISLLREGQTLHFSVLRRTIKTKVAVPTMLDDKIGHVKIVNFNTSCFAETKAAVEELKAQGAEAIIFDVRFNGGGFVTEMVSLLDYLLPEGELFRSVNYKGDTEVKISDGAFLDMPMAVLVNGESYSAAEFFAAALEEYDAAVVVGEKTSGKGYFQQTFQLSDGSAVAISTGKYFTPKGVSLEGIGLTPAVEVPVDAETAAAIYAGSLPLQEDPQVIAAINALKSAK